VVLAARRPITALQLSEKARRFRWRAISRIF